MFTDELDDIVASLQTIKIDNDNEGDVNQILGQLDRIIDAEPTNFETLNLYSSLVPLFTTTSPIELKTKIAKCMAEITKNEKQRRQFTNTTIIQQLIDVLDTEPHTKTNDLSTKSLAYIIQSCRALGNICYNNDDANNILIQLNKDNVLIRLLDVTLNKNEATAENDSEIKELNLLFNKVRCGLISNYLVGSEVIAKRAADLGIMQKFEQIIEKCSKMSDDSENEDILLNTLAPLTILTENVTELSFSPSLNRNLVKILGVSKNPDIAEMCLDLLHEQAENGKILIMSYGECF